MSDNGDINGDGERRNYTGPYTPHHPVPTVQRYHEHQHQRRADEEDGQGRTGQGNEESGIRKVLGGVKRMVNGEDPGDTGEDGKHPYPTENRNIEGSGQDASKTNNSTGLDYEDFKHDGYGEKSEDGGVGKRNHKENHKSAAEAAAAETDPRRKRKNMKHMKRDDGGREVTDPVTHLPIVIHDSTSKSLKNAPTNLLAAGLESRTLTGLSGASKSSSQLDQETREVNESHQGMEKLFPPPHFEDLRAELVDAFKFALTVGLCSILVLATLLLVTWQLLGLRQRDSHRSLDSSAKWTRVFVPVFLVVTLSSVCGGFIVWGIRGWLEKKATGIWDDEVWESARSREQEEVKTSTPESTQWLNSLLSSIWPLINPDLFTSLADTLEDVMQASLPKVVRMISVDDLGQGSEALRILGVRWLPTGAAAASVSKDGEIKSSKSQETSDRTNPGEGEVELDTGENDSDSQDSLQKGREEDKSHLEEEEAIAEGMEAEQGDFVNVEIAFSYRARSSGKSLKTKAKNAHLYLAFYLVAGIKIPVWVEMKATITFLGQPKADLSCVPLSKHSLNLMDVPLISSFVQSSIDAALAEYVAPKSLTLDLKDMLVGDDFKKDTSARGVIIARIKRAQDFKEGDVNLGPFKNGSADPYVTVGWAKFGKPVFSTRVILKEMKPIWEEWAYVLVGPEQLNAEEILRVQLWDSDRATADDNLGRIEVELKELMQDPSTKGKLADRRDEFVGEDGKEKMPGYLDWSVGYFPKTRITGEQLSKQSEEPDIKNVDQLKEKVTETAEGKLREATRHDESRELKQQEVQDYKEREDKLMISSPPPSDYPSGIFSIQVHQITGLEFEQANKNRKDDQKGENDDEEEEDDLPSSYCTVILNHQRIFKTRTKPKNTKPFFNAGTERFVRDWRSADVMISVRDSRIHENDPLLGMVYLPLGRLFEKRSQVNDSFPLVGGIAYGRARISVVFRSVQLQVPTELIGWDYGTLEFTAHIKTRNLPTDIRSLRLKARTSVARGKFYPEGDGSEYKPKHDRKVCIPVRKRYSSAVIFEFRKSTLGLDKTPAFGVFWLKDIPDDEDKTMTVKVWPGSADQKRMSTCCHADPDDCEPIGELEVSMKFWHGLSGYHKGLASKDKGLKDVMEVLDTANDNKEADDEEPGGSDDESDSSDDGENDRGSIKHKLNKLLDTRGSGEENGERGPLEQIKDYKDHRKQLHRQHRGLMQWKIPRTVDWIKTKGQNGKHHIMGRFMHSDERATGVETEV